MTSAILFLALAMSFVFVPRAPASDHKLAAEEFIRGLYGCKPEVVDKLAADKIRVSYPIFETLFKKAVLSGKTEVTNFGKRFCSVWKDQELKIDEVIEEGNQVVFVWSFKAESVGNVPGAPEKGTVRAWGGISLFRFDDHGKITLELGEESEPGPMGRLRGK